MECVASVLIGDKGVGKTALNTFYTCHTWHPDTLPNVADQYNAYVMVDGRPIQLTLCDTDGSHKSTDTLYKEINRMDVCLLMFDIMRPDTFLNVASFWAKELKQIKKDYGLDIPLILVGNKEGERRHFESQLESTMIPRHVFNERDAQYLVFGFVHKHLTELIIPECLINICFEYYFEISPITKEQGMKMAKDIGAIKYIETCCYTQTGVKTVFDEAIRAVFKRRYKPRRKVGCIVL